MRSVAVGNLRNQSVVTTGTCASLSVVVVSSGSALAAQRATQALKTASRDFPAQLIVVAQDDDPTFVLSVERTGAEFVVAPPGCSRAEMCDLGMLHASGTIVAVRDDVAIGDASWLDAYRALLPKAKPSAAAPMESVVMNSMVAGRVGLADTATSFNTPEAKASTASIEMAAAG